MVSALHIERDFIFKFAYGGSPPRRHLACDSSWQKNLLGENFTLSLVNSIIYVRLFNLQSTYNNLYNIHMI